MARNLDHGSERAIKHAIVTITERDVRRFSPCEGGIEEAVTLGLLPLTISTDPDENIEIALEIVDAERARLWNDDVWWLLSKVTESLYTWNTSAKYAGVFALANSELISSNSATDACVVTQQLAALADVIHSTARLRALRRRA